MPTRKGGGRKLRQKVKALGLACNGFCQDLPGESSQRHPMPGISRDGELLRPNTGKKWQTPCGDPKGSAPSMGQWHIGQLRENFAQRLADLGKNILWESGAIAFTAAKNQSIVMAEAIVIEHETVIGNSDRFAQNLLRPLQRRAYF